jgi:predicted HicB family RNase H-like nuclease
LYDPHQETEKPGFRILNVRLNPSLHEQLQRLAQDNGDTVASTIRALLRNGIEQRQVAR